jgi:integrase
MNTSALEEWYATERLRKTGREASRNTVASKASRLRSVARLVGTNDVPALVRALEHGGVMESALAQLCSTLKPNSVRITVHALCTLDAYARTVGLSNGLALLKGDAPPSHARGPVTVYDTEQLAALLDAAKHDTRWHLFLLILMDTGMRIGEVLSLQWTDLRLASTPPFVELPTTKTRPRLVPLSRRVVQALSPEVEARLRSEKRPDRRGARSYAKDPAVYVFPFSYSAAQQRLRVTCRHAGVPYRGPHHFRHTFATRLLAKGVDILPVSQLLGHDSIVITAAYYSHTTALQYAKYLE